MFGPVQIFVSRPLTSIFDGAQETFFDPFSSANIIYDLLYPTIDLQSLVTNLQSPTIDLRFLPLDLRFTPLPMSSSKSGDHI